MKNIETGESYFIFTDGACSGNPGPGGWAAIIVGDGRLVEIGGADPRTTNNRMEMTAAIEALKSVPPAATVKLWSDSSYLVKGITEWIGGWKRRGWKKAGGEPVLNSDLWMELDRLARPGVEWLLLPGHAGHYLNERCDEIAVSFSQGKRIPLRNTDLVSAADLGEIRAALSKSLNGPGPKKEPRSKEPRSGSRPRGAKAPKKYLFVFKNRVYVFSKWEDCRAFSSGLPGYPKACTSRIEEEEYVKRHGLGPGDLDNAVKK